MNERIKQLAEQASHQSPDGYPVTIPYSKDFAEKLVELVVRECADFVDSHEQVDKWGEAQNIVYGTDLLTHFGVTE